PLYSTLVTKTMRSRPHSLLQPSSSIALPSSHSSGNSTTPSPQPDAGPVVSVVTAVSATVSESDASVVAVPASEPPPVSAPEEPPAVVSPAVVLSAPDEVAPSVVVPSSHGKPIGRRHPATGSHATTRVQDADRLVM